MSERFYSVENGEKTLDFSKIGQMNNVKARFVIKEEFHGINGQWNGIHQMDLEGYVLCEDDNGLDYYKICGFGEDSKVLLETKKTLKEDKKLLIALREFCDGYNPHNNLLLTEEVVGQLLTE